MDENSKNNVTSKSSEWLSDLNALLINAEVEALAKQNSKLQYPICFIVGAPHSGTDLILRWMAATNAFSYPSNIISRFFMAPYIGAKIQRMLSDPEIIAENDITIPDTNHENYYLSEVEKPGSLFSPSSFNPFWKRFFSFNGTAQLSEELLSEVDTLLLSSELSAFESVYNKPVVLKATLLNWHVNFLAELFENSIFIFLKRKTYFNIQSLLITRNSMNDPNEWFAAKPPEYEKLKKMNIYKQLAGQIHFSNKTIDKALFDLPNCRKITISYEEFCEKPLQLWDLLNNRFNQSGFTLHRNYSGMKNFESRNTIKVSKEEKERIAAAYYSLFGEDISPDH